MGKSLANMPLTADFGDRKGSLTGLPPRNQPLADTPPSDTPPLRCKPSGRHQTWLVNSEPSGKGHPGQLLQWAFAHASPKFSPEFCVRALTTRLVWPDHRLRRSLNRVFLLHPADAGRSSFKTHRCSVALAAGVSVPPDEKLPPGTRLDLVTVQKSADAGVSAISTRRHRKCSHSPSSRDRVASSVRSAECIFPPQRLLHATSKAGFQPRPARWAPRHKSLCRDDERTPPAPPLIRPGTLIPEINAR